MLITSYFGDEFAIARRGEVDGLPMCEVRHRKRDGQQRATTYRLIQRPNGWHNVGRFTNIPGRPGGFIPAPEPRGKKLSGSRLDLSLLCMAEEGHRPC